MPISTDFTLEDFMNQMSKVQKLGPAGKLIGLLPPMRDMMKQVKMSEADLERSLARMRTIYNAMTADQRDTPDAITPDDRHRIASRAAVKVTDVSRFLNDFNQSREMMRSVRRMHPINPPPPSKVLGLVTSNKFTRDPSFLYNPPRRHNLYWFLAALLTATLLTFLWTLMPK